MATIKGEEEVKNIHFQIAVFGIGFIMLATTGICAEPLNVKGVSAGMTKAQVKGIIGGKWQCYAEGLPKAILEARKARGQDLADECGHAIPHPVRPRDSYAGFDVDIDYYFRNDALVKITVSGLKPDNFDTVATALEKKFGTPLKEDHTPTENAMGTKFQNDSLTWSDGKIDLLYVRRCGLVSASCMQLETKEFAAIEAAKTAAKASDM